MATLQAFEGGQERPHMAQAYSDPERETHPYALPDIEVWHGTERYCENCGEFDNYCDCRADKVEKTGYWYWFCFPGCLPNGNPIGPFDTETEALENAREGME